MPTRRPDGVVSLLVFTLRAYYSLPYHVSTGQGDYYPKTSKKDISIYTNKVLLVYNVV